jgi:site-specific DNA-methyltransferase (adenine-specific)
MNKQEFLNAQIVLFNGDCLDVMRNLKDKEINLVLTDPPYGLSYDKAAAKRSGKQYGKAAAQATKFHSTNWDILPDQKIFNELLRISKNQIIFGAEHLCLMLPKSRGWIVWDKNTGENNFSDCELAWTSFDKPIRKFFYTWNGMIQQNMGDKEVRIHPTQKPTGLMNWCILNNSKENDLIFDGFLGSGTTAISSIRTKRRLIGCELDNEYFDKMCKRIEEELRQGVLF